VAAFTFGARFLGAVREMFVARHFGTSDQVDAFVLALAVCTFVFGVVAPPAGGALVPTYVALRDREGPAEAERLFSTTMLASAALFAVTAAVVAAALPILLPILTPQFSPEKRHLTATLTAWLLPGFALSGLTTCWTGVLNAHGRFAAPAAAAAVVPVTAIAALVRFGHAWGISALVVGLVAGYALEAAIVAAVLRARRLRVLPRWWREVRGFRTVLGQYAPMVAGSLIMGGNPIIDQVMAARLAPGSVAALGYGAKVYSFAAGIATVALSAAIFPHYAALTASRDWDRLSRTIRDWAVLVLVVTVPATIVGVVFSEDLVRLLFQRGAFTAADTLVTARIQAFYMLQAPFHLGSIVLVRFVTASNGNRFLVWVSSLNAVANVIGNYVLSARLGVAGIALSTSLVQALAFAVLLLHVRRRLRLLRGTDPLEAEARSETA
jgi:putative peptidoglycan lipid II flippase